MPVSVELKRRSMEDSGYPLSFDDLQYFRVGSEMALGLLLTRVIPMKCLVPRTRASTVPMLCYASLICRHFLSRFARGTKARKFNVLQHWTTRQMEGHIGAMYKLRMLNFWILAPSPLVSNKFRPFFNHIFTEPSPSIGADIIHTWPQAWPNGGGKTVFVSTPSPSLPLFDRFDLPSASVRVRWLVHYFTFSKRPL